MMWNALSLLNDCIIYFSIQLGRCVLLSFPVLALALILRAVILRKTVFLRGMVWSIFLIVPFVGKLKLFYENMLMCRLFMWWNNICMEYWQVRYGYVMGMIVTASLIIWKHKKLCRVVSRMEKSRIDGQEIYINEMTVTPFTTGLIHTKTIVPKVMLQNFRAEELKMILFHERTHIRLGHLWYYLLWDVIRVLLWLNPLLAVCRRLFIEDMEDICDKVTIQKSKKPAYEYGMLLLKCVKLLRSENTGLSVTFAGEKDYRDTKRRFVKIAAFIPYKKWKVSAICLCGAAALMGIFLLVKQLSYPCYTENTDIVLMNEQGEMWMLYDSEELRSAFYADGQDVHIDRKAMDGILQKYGITENTFYLSFGGYRKIPGLGGGGSLVYVDYGKGNEKLIIPYWNRDADIAARIFKGI
ncbi:MAG: M56 family metallopeptidase [Bacillus sp. (in: Bacteria)]|nr:M56 family metallopeptidase [Bacillus sp. (in: firmicutes)]MCM1427281.1 M56 family metallopeptidase [Eubacterium sp.]